MKIENNPVAIGQTVFFPVKPADPKTKYKSGEVVEINESVRAVKLLFCASGSSAKDNARLKREWIAASLCRLSDPAKVEVVK